MYNLYLYLQKGTDISEIFKSVYHHPPTPTPPRNNSRSESETVLSTIK